MKYVSSGLFSLQLNIAPRIDTMCQVDATYLNIERVINVNVSQINE